MRTLGLRLGKDAAHTLTIQCSYTPQLLLQIVQPQFAAAFSNGMEYFNTYGGCTAAGAAGMATLCVIQEEKFQQRAARVGLYLTAKLKVLKEVLLVPRVCELCSHRSLPFPFFGRLLFDVQLF